MPIDADNIEKYIFDPSNPKQCKAYKLLLSCAKKNPFVSISSDFLTIDFEQAILGGGFRDELWDEPEDFEDMDIFKKIEIYQNLLTEKDYFNYIDSLKIDADALTYRKIFNQFFDWLQIYFVITPYDEALIKLKLNYLPRRSIKNAKFISTYYSQIEGSKVLFENNDLSILEEGKNFFDVASVVVTGIENIEEFVHEKFNKNVKPIFLQDLHDIHLLLNVLQDDLKREKNKLKKSEEPSYISSIKIKNIFSIKEIVLENLDDKKEIYIVGENGDGKTLLLQSLALGLKGVDEGVVFDFIKSQKEYSVEIEDTNKVIYNSKNGSYKNLFAYGANRNNNCQMKEDETGYLTLFHPSFDLKNPIEWLQRIDYNDKAGTKNIISVEDAKKLLKELLNSDVEIEIAPSAVTFSEKGSHVNFEQLSAGYRGVITIIADLLIRLSENQPDVKHLKEFKGIVIIDEVELHLHPKWKYSFVKKLRDVFPNIQFIMTTHSPTVLLGASKEAVFYKIYKEDGEVQISNQIKNEGYTSNSLVSSPLFELETITSRDYTKNVSSDDYVYEKIHQVISEKIKNESAINEQEILKLIEEELAKL